MGCIVVLDQNMVNMIAAGEVIERTRISQTSPKNCQSQIICFAATGRNDRQIAFCELKIEDCVKRCD